MPTKVFFDTCVLYPPLLRNVLLILAEADFYEPYWSDGVLEELNRNLLKANKTSDQVNRLFSEMNNYFSDALVKNWLYQAKEAGMQNDPKDRHVLAVAVIAEVEFLVTDNTRDFPKPIAAQFNIEIQTADEFLLTQFQLNPYGIMNTLNQWIKDSRKPKTFESVTTQLAKTVPHFTESFIKFYAAHQ